MIEVIKTLRKVREVLRVFRSTCLTMMRCLRIHLSVTYNYFFFFAFFTAPYFLRAAFSQPERLEPCFLWQAFSAAASFAARSCAAVLAFGQPVTSMWVSWLSVAPLWATKAVGIVSFCWQRLPLAARGVYLPWGRFSSKLHTGASGTVVNVGDVMSPRCRVPHRIVVLSTPQQDSDQIAAWQSVMT
jgi:hypothetical protein